MHGTAADLRLLDGTIDPSDREVGMTLWGPPATANYLPAGIGRCCSVRSWLNQWSIDHTLGDSLRWLPQVQCPLLVLSPTADTAVPIHVGREMYDAAVKADREIIEIEGATHCFEGQPDLLDRALDALTAWVERV